MQLKFTIYVLIVSNVSAMVSSKPEGFSFPTPEAVEVDENNDRSYYNRRYNEFVQPSLINSINNELPKEAKFFDLNDFDCKYNGLMVSNVCLVTSDSDSSCQLKFMKCSIRYG